MADNFDNQILPTDWTPEDQMIKVIGVGGGGCNAVTYMYDQGIEGCSFFVCNTDNQALQKSTVPNKIPLGEGLGAGTDPVKGRKAAIEHQDLIREKILTPATRMLFITAGMGGGTGTGASPVIAKMSKEAGILTVAVVTLPFKNEGDDFLSKAVDGIHELQGFVDSLLIINNEKLYDFFGSELIQDAFPKANEVLATAVRGIIEIITKPGYINVDFQDVCTMMSNSGMALMGIGEGTGENRLEDAVKGALESPLLNDFDLSTCNNLLLNVTVSRGEKGLKMQELNQLTDMVTKYTGKTQKFKRGIIFDDSEDFGDKVRITAIATGFKMNLIGITGSDMGKFILVDRDTFTYDPHPVCQRDENGEIDLPEEEMTIRKIGYDSTENKPIFHFNEDQKPVLVLDPGQSKAELEGTAAIRRKEYSNRQNG
jgi:cell division protein FtsZ